MYTPEQQRAFYDLSKELLEHRGDLPSREAAESVMRDLRDVIIYHEWRYYVLNEPVVSDFEYDQLFKRLQELEALFPEMVAPDSPTQRVSADLTEDFPSVEHLTPMLSLANSYDAEDLNDFDEQVKKLTLLPDDEEVEYVVEPKFDGGTIALVYENDALARAATRGNGIMGEEMTANARVIRSIPLKATFSAYGLARAELRGRCSSAKTFSTRSTSAARRRDWQSSPTPATPPPAGCA
jgi:DNA ligase (NAD+)